MKRFLAIYTGSRDSAEKAQWDKLNAEERQKREADGIQAWIDWGTAHADAIVDQGNPLGKTKRIGRDGITDIRNDVTGYVIVRADSHEAAAKLFENHPHFTIFPGDGVEIMECLPLPI